MAQKQLYKPKTFLMPPWVSALLIALYLGLLTALVLLPGASLLDRLRWLDSGVCAQLPSHSFYPGGERLPLCARNTGIYLGFIVSLITLLITSRRRAQHLPPWPIVIILACGVLALAVDGFNSLALDLGMFHLYQPHNLIRLATGLITGLALASLTLPMLNRMFWNTYDEKRSIPSWTAFAVFIALLVICFFAVSSQSILVLYPIALLSTLGIVTALSTINLILIVAASRHDGTFGRYHELLPFVGLSVLFAIGELLILAQLKFSLLQALGMSM